MRAEIPPADKAGGAKRKFPGEDVLAPFLYKPSRPASARVSPSLLMKAVSGGKASSCRFHRQAMDDLPTNSGELILRVELCRQVWRQPKRDGAGFAQPLIL
jgi:hypothetical protein